MHTLTDTCFCISQSACITCLTMETSNGNFVVINSPLRSFSQWQGLKHHSSLTEVCYINSSIHIMYTNSQLLFQLFGTVLNPMQCNHQLALDQFINQVSEPPVKIAAIGGGCSLATEPTAGISHYWQIPQVQVYDIYSL